MFYIKTHTYIRIRAYNMIDVIFSASQSLPIPGKPSRAKKIIQHVRIPKFKSKSGVRYFYNELVHIIKVDRYKDVRHLFKDKYTSSYLFDRVIYI